jgi:adenylate cyclase
MADSGVQNVIDWLIDGARSAERSDLVLGELCERIVKAGVPLWRVGIFVRTLHPDVFGRSFVWRPDTGVVTATAGHEIVDSDTYKSSPLAQLYSSGETVRHRIALGDIIRQRIEAGENIDAYPILRELRDEGVTDYIAIPLRFTDGTVHGSSWTTREPGGFTPVQLAALQNIVAPLARVAEIRALQRTAINLLDTYVGNSAGARILAGQIRRGYADHLHAVIWLSDMRGFTALSDRVAPERVVEVLNRYFDCQVSAVSNHGGEVLKFMGDGMLAIFPVHDDAGAQSICVRALSAAREARGNVDTLNAAQGAWSKDRLRFGIALHVGKVLYGNIGGGNRLDFTCIGPAVNLAARIEKIAGKLGRTIVASADFAGHCDQEWEHAGEFNVSGFSAPHAVFGLRDEQAFPR